MDRIMVYIRNIFSINYGFSHSHTLSISHISQTINDQSSNFSHLNNINVVDIQASSLIGRACHLHKLDSGHFLHSIQT